MAHHFLMDKYAYVRVYIYSSLLNLHVSFLCLALAGGFKNIDSYP